MSKAPPRCAKHSSDGGEITEFFFWFFFFIGIFLFLPGITFAQVVINEFSSASDDDWIEIYNTSTSEVSLSGWVIKDTATTPVYAFAELTVLPGSGFCVQSVDERLNKDGDRIKLFQNETEKDCVAYGDGNKEFCNSVADIDAPIGSLVAARKPNSIGGWVITSETPGFSNDETSPPSSKILCYILSPTLAPTPTLTISPTLTPTSTLTLTPAPTSYSNIYISEFMAWPESGNEWVELFNNNDSEVNLFGWYIDDITGGGKSPRAISGTILAKSYKQFFLDDSFFNNNGDDVRLLDGGQAEKDKKSFTTSTKGKSWSKDSSGDWCQTDPTPNSANPDCPSSAASPTNTLTPSLSPTPTQKLTPTPTLVSDEVLGEETASEGGQFTLSGAAGSSPASGQNEVKPGKSLSDRKRSIIFASVMSLGGIALTGFSVYSLWRRKKLVSEIKL